MGFLQAYLYCLMALRENQEEHRSPFGFPLKTKGPAAGSRLATASSTNQHRLGTVTQKQWLGPLPLKTPCALGKFSSFTDKFCPCYPQKVGKSVVFLRGKSPFERRAAHFFPWTEDQTTTAEASAVWPSGLSARYPHGGRAAFSGGPGRPGRWLRARPILKKLFGRVCFWGKPFWLYCTRKNKRKAL